MELRDYQQKIVDFLLKTKRAYLGAFMGAGKTVSTLTAIEAMSFNENVYPIIVIAPRRVAAETWPTEVKKFPWLKHLKVSPIIGTSPAKREQALLTPAQIYTINYENLPWLVFTLKGRWPFRVTVCDEASKLKGFRTKQGTERAKALSKVIHNSSRVILMSGTPCANGLLDLWGQYYFLDAGTRLGNTFEFFQRRWFIENPATGVLEPRDKQAEQEIKAAIKDITFAIDPRDYMDIGTPIYTPIHVTLPTRAQMVYDEMSAKFYTELGDDIEVAKIGIKALVVAARTTKLMQIASGFIYDNGDEQKNVTPYTLHTEKLDALEDIVENSGGEPILVAYQFKHEQAMIRTRFPKARHINDAPNIEKQWNLGQIPMLLVHPKSAGHGLNLQHGGRILVYYSAGWSLEEHEQVAERIGPTRQAQSGYNRAVLIYHLIASNTIEEVVQRRLRTKSSVQAIMMEEMKRRGLA